MSSSYLDRVNSIINHIPDSNAIRIRSTEDAGKYIDKEKFVNVIRTTLNDMNEWFKDHNIVDYQRFTTAFYFPTDNIVSIKMQGTYHRDGKHLTHTIKRKVGTGTSKYQEYKTSTVIGDDNCMDFSPEMDQKFLFGDTFQPLDQLFS